MTQRRFAPRFVEYLPEALEEGVVYVSMPYAVAAHRCACGCGREVVTPLSPTDWKLIFDGENVSLDPSIGNWSFPCRAHYFIRGGGVQWAADMTDSAIHRGRLNDRAAKNAHYDKGTAPGGKLDGAQARKVPAESPPTNQRTRGGWDWLTRWFK